MSNASVKAGLIGAGVAVLLSLLSLIPCLGFIASLLGLVLYAGVGVLTAYWQEPPRDVGRGAGGGAVAGLIAGLAGRITSVVRFTVFGGQAALSRQFRQLPPEIRRQWRELGLDPQMLARPGWVVGSSAICCGAGLLLAAALGAAGGAIMASIKSGEDADEFTSV